MQIFFLTPNRNMSVGKCVNWESLFCLALFWEHFIFNFKRVDIRKMSEVIWVKMYCKMGDLFRWFLLGLIFSAINSGIKKIWWSDDGTRGIKLYAQNNISKKKNYKYEIWNHLHFDPGFNFVGLLLGGFFLIFRPRSNVIINIFTQLHPLPSPHSPQKLFLWSYINIGKGRLTAIMKIHSFNIA